MYVISSISPFSSSGTPLARFHCASNRFNMICGCALPEPPDARRRSPHRIADILNPLDIFEEKSVFELIGVGMHKVAGIVAIEQYIVRLQGFQQLCLQTPANADILVVIPWNRKEPGAARHKALDSLENVRSCHGYVLDAGTRKGSQEPAGYGLPPLGDI